MSSWLLLALAILLEVAGTTCMKLSQGLTRLGPTVGIAGFYLASFVCVALALERIEVGLAYAIWAGLGIVLITLVGVFYFGETMTGWRALCITLIVFGVIGLNLTQT